VARRAKNPEARRIPGDFRYVVPEPGRSTDFGQPSDGAGLGILPGDPGYRSIVDKFVHFKKIKNYILVVYRFLRTEKSTYFILKRLLFFTWQLFCRAGFSIFSTFWGVYFFLICKYVSLSYLCTLKPVNKYIKKERKKKRKGLTCDMIVSLCLSE
jgi:hypothetical protein